MLGFCNMADEMLRHALLNLQTTNLPQKPKQRRWYLYMSLTAASEHAHYSRNAFSLK